MTTRSATIRADADARRRFEAKYRENENGCWIWTAKSEDKDGYGQFRNKGVLYRAHRFAWLLYRGELEPGMDVDHVCPGAPHRRCVNPDHLEVITHGENMRRQRRRREVVPPWQQEDGHVPSSNGSERVMRWVDELLKSYECKGPFEHLAIGSVDGSPWREYEHDFEKGFLEVHDKFALAALYLYAVRMGADARVAAIRILKASPITVHSWNRNPAWKDDMAAARREGKTQRYDDLEHGIIDRLEAQIPHAQMKDVVSALKVINQREALSAKRSQTVQVSSGRNITFRILTTPDRAGELMSGVIDAMALETKERFLPALPAPEECEGESDDAQEE
jgi:hypothetical protein